MLCGKAKGYPGNETEMASIEIACCGGVRQFKIFNDIYAKQKNVVIIMLCYHQ